MAAAIFMAPAPGLMARAVRTVWISRPHLFNNKNTNALSFHRTRFQPCPLPTLQTPSGGNGVGSSLGEEACMPEKAFTTDTYSYANGDKFGMVHKCGVECSACTVLLPKTWPETVTTSIKKITLKEMRIGRDQGICHAAHALKGEDGVLLKGVGNKSGTASVKHILEMAGRASSRREILQTDFLTPPILKEAMLTLEKFADVKAVAQGGYPEAERCCLLVGHSEAMESIPDAVAALSITGNFGFQPCSHGDFLGSILGTGIAREKVGDIILQEEKGAQVIVVPELVDFLIASLEKVGNVSVSCSKIPLLALEYEPPKTKSFKTIEASLRVDALASAGFKISRSKLVDLISNGDVRVNWSPVTKNGTTLKTGDVVSVSGKGRLKIGEINTTKKGKYAVELIQYL